MAKLTKKQMIQYQKEIKQFYYYRKLFLGLGWGLIGTGFLIAVFGVYRADYISHDTGMLIFFVGFLTLFGGISLLILRGPLFNRRIRNRKIAIKETKEQLEIKALYAKQEENKSED